MYFKSLEKTYFEKKLQPANDTEKKHFHLDSV